MATRRVSAPMSSAAELRRFEIQGAHERRKELGRGAYGEVKVYDVDGVPCAGKVMHEFLLRSAGGDGVRRYIDECKLLAKLVHPNIVQFMGVTFPRGAALPVLLMERLPIDLDGLLENTPNIPIGIRATFLTDIARGLNYLHSQRPPVIHRDLSARNVLLSAILVAKISDLGNSRIVNLSPNEVSRLTHAPGSPLYMPPEALETSPSYGPSLDVFSFGQIALFAATQCVCVCVCVCVCACVRACVRVRAFNCKIQGVSMCMCFYACRVCAFMRAVYVHSSVFRQTVKLGVSGGVDRIAMH